MILVEAVLESRRQVAAGMFVLRFHAPGTGDGARAGQFVNLGLDPGPLLRRPFSIHRVEGDAIEVLLKPVGTGTAALAAMRAGDRVSCLGPLGSPFRIEPGGDPVVLVSGGLGVAPMPMLAAEAAALGLRVTWVHGARTAAELCSEWAGDEVVWVTEDGSRGVRGRVLEGLPEGPAQVFACGPNPMLSALAASHPAAQVAIETYMGCGTGVCLGCAVPLQAGGYGRACTDGPVYVAGEITWQALPGHLHHAVAG